VESILTSKSSTNLNRLEVKVACVYSELCFTRTPFIACRVWRTLDISLSMETATTGKADSEDSEVSVAGVFIGMVNWRGMAMGEK
jgi:hypothetical protein